MNLKKFKPNPWALVIIICWLLMILAINIYA